MNNGDDDIAALARIAALPIEEQRDAIHELIGSVLKGMSVSTILEIKQEIESQFEADIPIVKATMELIDGQLALREIAGTEGWR